MEFVDRDAVIGLVRTAALFPCAHLHEEGIHEWNLLVEMQ